jgi:8-oxo-dGTP pyrophosphatase MutT (NUDIX family)
VSPTGNALRVVALAVVRHANLLLVAKSAAPHVFFLPGGKPEPGESHTETLQRELGEELGVACVDLDHLLEVRRPAALEHVPMHMTVYRGQLLGRPARASEIASVRWWPRDSVPEIAPAVAGDVIPLLIKTGALSAPWRM